MKRNLALLTASLMLLLAVAACQGQAPSASQGETMASPGRATPASQDPDRIVESLTATLKQGKLDPQTMAQTHHKRGMARAQLGQLREAISDFDQAITLNDSFAAAYEQRGQLYNRLSQYDKALADLDMAIRLEPSSAPAYFLRSFPLAAMGRNAQAVADLEQALKLSPGNDIYRNRLNSLLRPEMRLPKAGPKSLPAPGGKVTGTGFVVSPQGHVLTNLHVVKDAREVRAQGVGEPLQVRAIDALTDLALLQMSKPGEKMASFAAGRSPRPGESVVVVGFPLQGLLASGPSVSTGAIGALAGPGDNPNLLQITAPVQPGNSGGPLLDENGNVIGVVVGKLDAAKVNQAFGETPQNVNFAISGAVAKAFLQANGVDPRPAPAGAPAQSAADIAEKAAAYVVLLECVR